MSVGFTGCGMSGFFSGSDKGDFSQETKNATIINKKATRSIMPKIFKEFLLKKADRNVVNRDVRRVSTPAQKP